jgi:protein-disulfide isomerase
MEPSTQQSSPAIPIAIIAGFLFIAIAIFFTNGNAEPQPLVTQNSAETNEPTPGTIKQVDGSDYIKGNPNAPIMLVEYSDYDCLFCKQFHLTLNQIMDEYGVNGQVARVYRQFPLPQLHPNSPKISEAALCVGDIAGEDAFWEFTDLIFEGRDIDAPTNVTELPEYAEQVGVERAAYISCLEGNRMEAKVVESMEEGFNAGVRGTPTTFIIAGDQQAVLTGAESYDAIKAIVSRLVAQLEGTFEAPAAEAATE